MSCDKSTSPINISKQAVTGSCDKKCNLIYDYHESTCNVYRNVNYLELDYDASSKAPVSFNKIDHEVYKVRIYSPSLHTFNNEPAPAEIVIAHNGNGSNLLICIPLMESSITSECSKFMDKLIEGTQRLAPKVGNRATINVSDYNLNSFVPKLPYFYYESTLPFPPCNGNYNLVVFHTSTFDTIKKVTLDKLKKMIKPHKIKIQSGPDLFLSGLNARMTDKSDIYISCQPVSITDKKEGFSNYNENYTYNDEPNKIENVLMNNIVPIFIGSAFIFGLLINRNK